MYCKNCKIQNHFLSQGSRWTFQATRMNGDTFGWQILPDQMQATIQLINHISKKNWYNWYHLNLFTSSLLHCYQVTNPILILAFIPIFDYGVYPLLSEFIFYIISNKKSIENLGFYTFWWYYLVFWNFLFVQQATWWIVLVSQYQQINHI